jgi:hypothetical protein
VVYVVPGVMVLWGSLVLLIRPHGKGAFWLAGVAGTAAMAGVWLLLEPVLGGFEATVAAYGVLGLAVLGARRWAAKAAAARRPPRRYPVRERRLGPEERRAPALRQVPVDVPVVQSRAAELAARRSIRWKEHS